MESQLKEQLIPEQSNEVSVFLQHTLEILNLSQIEEAGEKKAVNNS
jgi:hypothetical protein